MIVTSKAPRKRPKRKKDHPVIVGPRIVKARRRGWPEVEVTEEVWDFFRRMGIKTVPDKS